MGIFMQRMLREYIGCEFGKVSNLRRKTSRPSLYLPQAIPRDSFGKLLKNRLYEFSGAG